MAAGAAAATVGGVASLGGGFLAAEAQRKADRAEAEAFERNAELIERQRAFNREAAERDRRLFAEEADQVIGGIVGAFAKGGVELSGSALSQLAAAEERKAEQLTALERESEFEDEIAGLRAQEQIRQAGDIRATSRQRRLATILGGVGGAASSFGSAAGSFK